MKKTILIVIISINSIAFSQSKIDTLCYNFKSDFLNKKIDLKFDLPKFSSSFLIKKETFFTIYNGVTQQNDNYIFEKGGLKYNYSNVIIENNFRGHKIDSFNPNGSSNITSGIISGFFNLLLK